MACIYFFFILYYLEPLKPTEDFHERILEHSSGILFCSSRLLFFYLLPELLAIGNYLPALEFLVKHF